MKLHLIQTTNLNSLYGENRVDLDGDLGGATLFLIQGPTGAGKSTLMDAVSLALFGTTPRLADLSSETARAEQLMSRGTGNAQAVVEFSKWEPAAGARRRYRATWTARRARGRADGNMQATERSLERLEQDGTAILLVSDKRDKITRPVFHGVLEGFTDKDFQRSMLLAQGRFDAMLHANAEERATILERLTDTGRYQKLGERAARMRGAWMGRLAELQARVEGISPIAPEQIEAARAAVTAHGKVLAGLEGTLARMAGWKDWLLGRDRAEGDLARTRAGQEAVDLQEQEAAISLGQLAEHERCGDAFDLVDQGRRARERRERLEGELTQLRAGQPQLLITAKGAAEAATKAEERAQKTDAGLASIRGPATAAREASQELHRGQAARREAKVALDDLKEKLEQAAADTKAQEELATQAMATLTACEEALAALAADGPLEALAEGIYEEAAGLTVSSRQAEEASRSLEVDQSAWRAARQQADTRAEHLAGTREEQVAPLEHLVQAAAEDLRIHLEADQQLLEPLSEQLRDEASGPASSKVDLVGRVHPLRLVPESAREEPPQAEARGVDTHLRRAQAREAALAAARDLLRDRLPVFDQASVRVAERDRAIATLAVRVEAAGQAQAAQEGAEATVQRALANVEDASTALSQAEQVRTPLQRIAALSAQRSTLGEAEECPLCGSADHPYLLRPPPQLLALDAEVERAELAWQACRSRQEEARVAHQSSREALARATHAVALATNEAQAARKAKEVAKAAADQALAAAGLPAGASREAVDEARAEIVKQGVVLRSSQEATAQRRFELERSVRALADTLAELETEARVLAEEEVRLDQWGKDLQGRRLALGAAREGLQASREALAQELATFGIQATPAEAAMPEVRARVAARKGAKEAAQAARVALEKATNNVEKALANQADRQSGAEAADGVVDLRTREETELAKAAASAMTALREAWQAVLDLEDPLDRVGRPAVEAGPEALLSDLEARLRAQRLAAAVADRSREGAEQELAAGRARIETLEGQAAVLEAEALALGGQLAVALEGLGLPDQATLTASRLGSDRVGELRALRDHLSTLRKQVDAEARAALQQRQRHEAARPEGISEDATAAALEPEIEEATATRDRLREERNAAQATLTIAERDAAARAEATATLGRAREQAAVWLRLHELIGLADGKAFRLFAQALNLDQLLARANRHLSRLSERYKLVTAREPETGLPTLEFIIEDRWKPGQPRSLKTLSGGESFLVSLAMALGLADLRTSSMPVETLLLDEGFGTLDPHTLDVALAALQQLQASGRQVGIISHVGALQESIEARVIIEPLGEGRSRVRTVRGGATG